MRCEMNDDRDAFVTEPAHDGKDLPDLTAVQRRRGLIKDKDPGPAAERLGNLD